MESKVYPGASKFQQGKKQLSYYCRSLGLSEGLYLVFVPNQARLPDFVAEGSEEIEDVLIKTFLVFYDEETDF